MSGAITFSYIPPNLRVPLFYAEFNNSAAGISQPVQRALLLGQSIATVVNQPTFVPSVGWAQSVFGAGSQLANQVAAYRLNDPVGELWVLPVNDAGGGTKATGTILVAGTATANGTLFLYLPNPFQNNAPIQVGVTSGQIATAIATAIGAAINAVPFLPVTASVSSATVTLTANNAGTLGNDIPIVLNYLGARGGQVTPPGLTISITNMTGGATDPALGSLPAWIGAASFDFIQNPWANATALGATTALMADAAGRWSYSIALYGHVFSGSRNTVANLQTLGAGFNDQHLSILGVNNASPTSAWIWSAAMLGAIVPSLKAQPNRPLQTLTIQGVLPEPVGLEIGFSNQQVLLTAGIANAVRAAGGVAQIVRMITTYQTNSFAQPDASYLDCETMYTLAAVIRFLKSDITQKFPRALLADNGTRLAPTPPGDVPVIVTPQILAGEIISAYAALVDQNLCQDEADFAAGLIVQRNVNDNARVDVLLDPYLVSGLRIFAVLTEFHLLTLAQAA